MGHAGRILYLFNNQVRLSLKLKQVEGRSGIIEQNLSIYWYQTETNLTQLKSLNISVPD